ncbi:hypothetical protein ALI144C_20610 [Actinosynnema sp. ALI-1.44]|uniref:helix-turn-helix transcriptional regulator n=1 Tax=Actinosynnema sp. ALI-1.44 TaxID=1933779 RepID=UPI00097C82A6|nr:helix-turn-helix transcriptional regulator [Actinosynnema sp. ALI-1.44]ONI80975.1 hypothetical protein ALI144C_20610 [Actinosynnema sp. ALI-1.44]
MRSLLDQHSLSLRKLAGDDEVHYSLTTLHRYFSGRALPPRHLVELISRRCGGDLCEMSELHDRARREGSNSGDLQLRVAVSSDDADSGGTGLSTSVPVDPLTRSLSLRLTFHFDGTTPDDAADILSGRRAGHARVEPVLDPPYSSA